ncbi:MAG: hypothetical protein WC468_01190 [Candidatus Paceibacterota bacterium]
MLSQISYYPIFGKPLIMYAGIITLSSFIATACLGLMVLRGRAKLNHHLTMVKISFLLALLHATLGILLFF